MKIQLLSDLHLEAHPQFRATPAPGADVLVLAGDIGSYQAGSQLVSEHFGLEPFSPLPQYGGWPVPVLLVPGNHEFDAQDFDAARLRLRRSCDQLGIALLDCDTLHVDGVEFVGTTLWSNFDALADHQGLCDEAQRAKARHKAFRAADFYLAKTGTTRAGQPFLAEAVRAEALRCLAWLEHTLAQPRQGPRVVVTHFAPSLRSADPRYGLVPGTAGFCNAFDRLLEHADVWLHGHLHAPSRYTVQGVGAAGRPWRCTVVANPLGYARKGEQDTFEPHATVTV